ncbi:hypothetical protein BJ508DRAFT_302011 [Ascobolus immersus RN42]|uniref:Uncharacterized protein n=1 Tax=Ascobolus immersus RN42 TaxID=1160509 RepID=A0A3N4IKI3_ASCIM|nr:hypothetical protein BJ508DRAFT_302011 [Ascobolus immersus RN42]
MHFSTLLSAGLVAFVPLASAFPFTVPEPVRHVGRSVDLSTRTLQDGKAVFKPIHPRAYSAALGLTKREDVSLSDLDLADKVRMIYGTPGEDPSTVLLTDLTLISPNGKRVIMMEQFETFTKEIDCVGTDGEMSLTFKDKEAFDYAGKAWGNGEFYMIANHDGCAPEDQRKAWLISTVTTDSGAQKVKLTSKAAEWKDVAGKFTLDFGKAKISSLAKRSILESRQPHAVPEANPGLFSDIGDKIKDGFNKVKDGVKDTVDKVKQKIGGVKDKVEDKVEDVKDKIDEKVDKVKDKVEEVVDKVKDKTDEVLDKTKDKTKEIVDKIHKGAKEVAKAIEDVVDDIGDHESEKGFSINIDSGSKGSRIDIPIPPIPGMPPMTAACVDCFVEGTLQFSGRLEVDDFKVSKFEFDASATGVGAKLALEVGITEKIAGDEELGTDGLTFEQSIIALPLAGGLVIEGIFSAGPKLDFKAGLTSSLSGKLSFTLGAEATLPDGQIHGDLVDPSKSTSTGFEQFSVKPVFDVNELTASYRIEAYAQPTLALGFDILGQFGFEAALKLRAPSVAADVKGGFKDSGFCSDKPEKKTGAEIKGTVGMSLGFGVTAKLGEGGKNSLFEKELVGLKKELGSACVSIA